jgi:ribonuclease HI
LARLTDPQLLRLIRQHLDLEGLLAAHPEVRRADVEALWSRLGLDPPPPRVAPRQPELFRPASPASRIVVARCDGAARGNPGPAAIGIVLQEPSGKTLARIGECVGHATNNVAEYSAVIRAVEEAVALGATELRLLLDSELLVQQLRGAYKVRAPHLRPLHQRALGLLQQLEQWSVRHVPRHENAAADRLANQALDAR